MEGYRHESNEGVWRDLGAIENLPRLHRRDRTTGRLVELPVGTSLERDLIIVFDDNGEIAFVTSSTCPHDPGTKLPDHIDVDRGLGTLTCRHRRNAWSRRDGTSVGDCASMVQVEYVVVGSRLVTLSSPSETTIEIKVAL